MMYVYTDQKDRGIEEITVELETKQAVSLGWE